MWMLYVYVVGTIILTAIYLAVIGFGLAPGQFIREHAASYRYNNQRENFYCWLGFGGAFSLIIWPLSMWCWAAYFFGHFYKINVNTAKGVRI